MGGGLADVGRRTREGKWSAIPENAGRTVDSIAELKAPVLVLAELLNRLLRC